MLARVKNTNKLRKWLSGVGVITAYIEPGNPWENGYCESFNARIRDEFLWKTIWQYV